MYNFNHYVMKQKLLILSVLLISGVNMMAQGNMKFGHIDSQELIMLMPETDSANVKFEKFVTDLNDALEGMQVEYRNKLNEYNQNMDKWTEAVRKTKEGGINDLLNRIRNFESQSQQDVQQKRAQLFQPISEKALKAIETVGKENNFTYIFDLATSAVVYKAENTIDVLPLVKKKLGIQ